MKEKLRLRDKVAMCSESSGYKAFCKDLKQIEIANSMVGLCQITAEVWLEKLNELTVTELRAYMDRYYPGLLNPFAGYKF